MTARKVRTERLDRPCAGSITKTVNVNAPPLRRVLEVRVAPDKATRRVVFDGTPVDVRL